MTEVRSSIRLSLKQIEKGETDAELLKEVGRSLHDWLFPNPINTHLKTTEAVARSKNAKLRLRIRIEPATIASLPLEFIYRAAGGYFLATNPKTAFSRYLSLPLPPGKVRRRDTPLHMLVIVADPTDQVRLDPNEWEKIITEALNKPLTENKMTLKVVKRATRREIRNAMLEQKPDIIQFIGHGIYQHGKGYLALVDEDTNETWRVDDERFANIFAGYDDHLGLISMATCDSAQSNDPQGFLGIAPQLVQRGTPAVLAMQYEVKIKTAKIFLEDFYSCVAAYKPIDWAVQSARNAISLEFGLDNREFATPVLYMRAENGDVF
ncbi:MAG: CHAT domain-containing protein [Okeania sp. SIO3C4]|nr:CHAT domain-containing protein [Okeania sp. SIO3C4]